MEILPESFGTSAAFPRWVVRHHIAAREFWLRFRKKATRETGIIWSEAVDQLLRFGCIDGVRKSLDSLRMLMMICKPGRECSTGLESSTRPLH